MAAKTRDTTPVVDDSTVSIEDRIARTRRLGSADDSELWQCYREALAAGDDQLAEDILRLRGLPAALAAIHQAALAELPKLQKQTADAEAAERELPAIREELAAARRAHAPSPEAAREIAKMVLELGERERTLSVVAGRHGDSIVAIGRLVKWLGREVVGDGEPAAAASLPASLHNAYIAALPNEPLPHATAWTALAAARQGKPKRRFLVKPAN